MKDRKGNPIRVGRCVVWYDPDEESRDLSRIWIVREIRGEDDDSIVLISDDFGEAEVFAHELERVEDFSYSNLRPDLVRCSNCEKLMLVDAGEDTCPYCSEQGRLADVVQNVDW